MSTVFLSYSREDTARIRPLADALGRAGHSVWWDQHIAAGDQFESAIEQALATADVVLVAWSEASIHSAWVKDEAAAGRDSGRLVPVTLDGCSPPLGFRQYQTIDLTAWTGGPRSRLLDQLQAAICAKADSSHLTPAPTSAARSPAPARRQLPGGRVLAAAAAASLLLVTGGLWYADALPGGGAGGIAPKVRLGQFAVISPGLSPELPQALNEEILAAFGSENLVSVITAGTGQPDGAPFLLDGSVRQLDDALRFTVNLKNVDTGAVVWSKAYDRFATDTLAPRQVAVAASQVVRCGLWGASSYAKRMPDEGLSLYLQFCSEYWGGSSADEQILEAARRVTAAVPDFSFGWSALALAAVPLAHRTGSPEAAQLRKEAWKAAENSIRLDRQNPEGYMAMAGLLPLHLFARREGLLQKAIGVRPTECGCERQIYGDFLTSVGRMEEAVDQYQRARAMMPLAPFSNVRLAQALHVVGRHDEADRIITEMLQMWPDAATLRLLKIKSAFWTGHYAEAIPLLDAPDLHLTQKQRDAIVAAFEALVSRDPARKAQVAAELQVMAADPRRNDRLIVAALAALGADAAALDASRNLIRNRDHALAAVLFEPNLSNARGTAQYAQLVTGLGLTGYWEASRHFPDICREARKPAFCPVA